MSGNNLEWYLNLNTAGLERGAEKAKLTLNALAKEKLGDVGLPTEFIGRGLLGPGMLAAGAVAGFTVGLKESVETASDLGDQVERIHEQTGFSVGSAYMLRDAFRSANLDLEDMSPEINKMQAHMADMLITGEKGGVLTALGLDVATIAKDSPEEQFRKIGLAIDAIRDPMEKTRVAMDFFGKTGAALIPVFASSSFREGGGLSETARLLQQHAAEFSEQETLNKHVFSNAWEQISVGVDSQLASSNIALDKWIAGTDLSARARAATAAEIGNLKGGPFWAVWDGFKSLYDSHKEARAYEKDPAAWMKAHPGAKSPGFNASDIGEGKMPIWGDDLARVGGGGAYASPYGTINHGDETRNALLREIRDAVREQKPSAARNNTLSLTPLAHFA